MARTRVSKTTDTPDALRADQDRVRSLKQRSITLVAGAAHLHLAYGSLNLFATGGDRELEAETDDISATYVSRVSIEAFSLTRGIPYDEALGQSPGDSMAARGTAVVHDLCHGDE